MESVPRAIDGHRALCPIISTHLQSNRIKLDFVGPQMIGLKKRKNYEKSNCKRTVWCQPCNVLHTTQEESEWWATTTMRHPSTRARYKTPPVYSWMYTMNFGWNTRPLGWTTGCVAFPTYCTTMTPFRLEFCIWEQQENGRTVRFCLLLRKTTILDVHFAHASSWLFTIPISKPFLTPSSQMQVKATHLSPKIFKFK